MRSSRATGTTTRTTKPRRARLAFVSSLLLLVVAACGGDDLLLPSSGEPARIEIVGENERADTVGQALQDSLVVLVTDPEGRPVQGVEVAFVAPAGGGLAPNDTVLTGPDGKAAIHYTLPTVSGEQTIEARAKPVVPSPSLTAIFHLSAEPEAAVGLVVADGDQQKGEVQTALPEPLVVKAVDRFGNGVPGVEVTWEATDGAVSPASVITGADGLGAAQRTLGARPGVYRTTAVAPALENSTVSFEATGVASPSPQLVLVTQPSASAAAGVPFERQPVLQLQDAIGAPLLRADVAVTVQIADGAGSLGGTTTARSNGEGRVSFSDLSIRGRTGDRTLLFAAVDFTPATSETIDVNPGPPDPGQSSASVPNGTAGAPTAITVRLEDAFGTPVEGAEGDVAISIEGVNPASGLEATDRGDGSYSASYTPLRTGTDQVVVLVNGAPVGGSPFLSVVVAGPADPSTATAQFTRSGFFDTILNVFVTTRDAQGNPVLHGGDLVQVQVDGGELRTAVDLGDGNYTHSDLVGFGTVSVTILLNGVSITGSPFAT